KQAHNYQNRRVKYTLREILRSFSGWLSGICGAHPHSLHDYGLLLVTIGPRSNRHSIAPGGRGLSQNTCCFKMVPPTSDWIGRGTHEREGGHDGPTENRAQRRGREYLPACPERSDTHGYYREPG